MRTSKTITDNERNAFDQFCAANHILNDQSAAAIRNGEHFGAYMGAWDENITDYTLRVALEKLRDSIVFIPKEQIECAEILGTLDQSQRNTVADWLSHQPRLEADGVKGMSNASVCVAWLLTRKYAITDANLTTALGNAQTSGKRQLFWKELPKQDRSIGPGGRLNHALVNKSEEGFMPRSQTNRTLRQVMEDNRPKTEPVVTPVSINTQFQAKAEALQGRSHGQTDQARKFFVMVPGTSTIDWEQTYIARERFLTAQAPLIRR
jgi:hypothetical protein